MRTRGATRVLGLLGFAVLALVGCNSAAPEDCQTVTRVDLSNVAPNDDTLPFRFPLDDFEVHAREADFCDHSWPNPEKYHAAEDFHLPAGTPVYAMADGEVSFSGPMGGYGWLIIVDHPQMNLYSLYGHLSPTRWRMEPGPVAKGDLIAYLGDEWENGGSRDEPLVAHLHLGVRAGQRTDYPGKGEWRWMAGWIRPCPKDLGWLQPSVVIAGQDVPPGGFQGPDAGLFEKWWTELVLIGVILVGAAWWFVVGIRKSRPLLLVAISVLLTGVAWYLRTRGLILVTPLFVFAAVSLLTGLAFASRTGWRTVTRSERGR